MGSVQGSTSHEGLSEGGEARNHEEIEAVKEAVFRAGALVSDAAAERIALAALNAVRSSGSAAQNHEGESKLVERIVEELCDPPSMRGDGGFEMGWRAAIRAVAEFGSVVPADHEAGRDTNNALKKG